MFRIFLAFFTLFVGTTQASWLQYYDIENIPIPKEIDPQVGGLQVMDDGRVALAFHRGEVMIYAPKTKSWTKFAHGLHEPLGVMQENENTLVVMQKPELTRLIDEDKDGKADLYQTVSDDFGMSGNYHEFAFGPAKDSQGNYYIALNVASNFAGIFQHIRGEFNPIGPSRKMMTNWRNDEWKNVNKHEAGRMFAKVPYRGWVLKVTPDGRTLPFASGFRSPNGLFVDKQDRLWVTDNQGDWLGTSPLYHVEEELFYGHPASLIWEKGWKKDPVKMPASELNAMRTLPAALFPQGELANSPTQPVATTKPELFGLPEGELLIGDMNQARLIRFLPDEVNGVKQGTLIPFLESNEFGIGNNRMDFDESGSLWVGKTHLGWAGDEGVRKVSWNKQPMLIVEQVSQSKEGFIMHFSQPINIDLLQLQVSSHHYHYHKEYGSEKLDLQQIGINNVVLSEDKRSLTIDLAAMPAKRLYTLELKKLVSESGAPLMGNILRYHLLERTTTFSSL